MAVAWTALWERTSDLMLLLDAEGRVRHTNAVRRLTRADPAGLPFAELFEQADRALIGDALRMAFTSGETERLDAGLLEAGGAVRRVRCELVIVPDERGPFCIVRAADVSAEHAARTELRMLQRLAAVGQLAGGVAHDFNNLLTVMLSQSEQALKAYARGEDVEPTLTQVRAASERAAAVAKQLLAVSRPGDVPVRTISLRPVLFDLLRMIERLIPENIVIDYQSLDTDDTVEADVGQLQQVLLNLCLNARDAMPGGGRLSVVTERVGVTPDASPVLRGLAGGSYVAIRVADTGTGMSAETLSRVFEPFFSTKPSSRGAGLGLTVSSDIVRQHGGAIRVTSQVGEGTCFEVLWPYSAARPTREDDDRATLPPMGTETVLVAEDEDMVRALLAEILRDAGYRVLLARDGLEAVELFGAHESEIALVVLDAIMPRLDGRGAYERIAAKAPGMRFLLSSGYGAEELNGGKDLPGVHRLDKPYVPSDLLRAVRAALT